MSRIFFNILIYWVHTLHIFCSSQPSNEFVVLFGGRYINELIVIDEDEATNKITNAIHSLNTSETEYFSKPDVSDVDGDSSVFNWNSMILYYPNDIDQLIDFYGDLNQSNDKLNQFDESIHQYGNMLFCNNINHPSCTSKIGPQNYPFSLHAPIAMNTDFDVNKIVISGQDNTDDYVRILGLYFAIHSNKYNNNDLQFTDIIWSNLFPNAQLKHITIWPLTIDTMDDDVSLSSGQISVDYTDLKQIYNDTGYASNWGNKYDDYYIIAKEDENIIIYLYAISALCSNEKMYNKYLQIDTIGTTNASTDSTGNNEEVVIDDDDDTFAWKTVAITFMILFVMGMIIIIILVIFCGDEFKRKKRGYRRTQMTETNDFSL